MSEDLSKHDEIIAEAREKYTVHHCGECEFRKSCINKFDSDECKDTRQSIMLGFGVEDGYFTNLLNRLEAAYKREQVTQCNHFNGAKVRDALSDACYAMFNFLKTKYGGYEEMANALDKAKAALAAPSRNVDCYDTVDDARKAHNAICERYDKCHLGCPLNNEEHYSAFDCFESWLFAEAKGDVK